MHPKDADGMVRSVDPDLTALSDFGLKWLPRPVCPRAFGAMFCVK